MPASWSDNCSTLQTDWQSYLYLMMDMVDELEEFVTVWLVAYEARHGSPPLQPRHRDEKEDKQGKEESNKKKYRPKGSKFRFSLFPQPGFMPKYIHVTTTGLLVSKHPDSHSRWLSLNALPESPDMKRCHLEKGSVMQEAVAQTFGGPARLADKWTEEEKVQDCMPWDFDRIRFTQFGRIS